MTGADVSFRALTKRFGRRGRWVLHGIDLDLPPGSTTVIVGDNGSGKSTLLRIGAGVTRPTGGTVVRPGRVGFVPERLAATTRFTGAEYLAHMGRIRGLEPRAVDARTRHLVDRLGLAPSPHERIGALSKGNRQKLVLAQAFLGPVDLLVLDEPFSGLDPPARAALEELTDESQADGTAVLVSSHHPLAPGPRMRQFRIDGGRLATVSAGPAPAVTGAHPVEVVLQPTTGAVDRREVAALTGVAGVTFDATDGRLVLVADGRHSDGILAAAIRLGWSVRSVRPVPPPERPR